MGGLNKFDDWTSFNFSTLEEFEKGEYPPSVYFLFDGIELVYIGETNNLYNRIYHHLNYGYACSIDFDRFYYLSASTDRKERRRTEEYYIEQYQPKWNGYKSELFLYWMGGKPTWEHIVKEAKKMEG